MDVQVLAAQRLVNSYIYRGVLQEPAGYFIAEDGMTGWPVVYGLIRVLQYELGVEILSDAFGPGTLGKLSEYYPVIDATHGTPEIWRVVQAALYCKGYAGEGAIEDETSRELEFIGRYNSQTASAIAQLKTDIGVASSEHFQGSGLEPKVFKCLLNTDPYYTSSGGSPELSTACRWLNAKYLHRRDYVAAPCDGSPSRGIQRALLLGIQYALELDDDTANGFFGVTTQAGVRDHRLAVRSIGEWVGFFRVGMLLNQRPNVTFSEKFDSALSQQVREFQSFSALPVTGVADFATWASLLVSCGDTSRVGAAADCATKLTPADLAALQQRGVTTVGRYLFTVPGTTLDKGIGENELGYFMQAGMAVFPIYQTSGNYLDYFTADQGTVDASSALGWLSDLGFAAGTTVYFAVDFDLMRHQIITHAIPYFTAISNVFHSFGDRYTIGVYGARLVCTMLADEGLTTSSFVLDMSTGYSGNLGFALPSNWAFDQISGFSLSAGDRIVDYDNNVMSGHDQGQRVFSSRMVPREDVLFSGSWDNLYTELIAKVRSFGHGERKQPAAIPSGEVFLHTLREALDKVAQHDQLITERANLMSIRKALIQVPILWEYYGITSDDVGGDALMNSWISGLVLPEGVYERLRTFGMLQTSTGISQIFPTQSLKSSQWVNRADTYGLDDVTGDPLSQDAVTIEWIGLYQDESFDVVRTASVIAWGASGVRSDGVQPEEIDAGSDGIIGLTASDTWIRAALRAYTGPFGDPHTEANATQEKAVYDIFEKYNKIARDN